jgi:hypothetical protein
MLDISHYPCVRVGTDCFHGVNEQNGPVETKKLRTVSVYNFVDNQQARPQTAT